MLVLMSKMKNLGADAQKQISILISYSFNFEDIVKQIWYIKLNFFSSMSPQLIFQKSDFVHVCYRGGKLGFKVRENMYNYQVASFYSMKKGSKNLAFQTNTSKDLREFRKGSCAAKV